MVPNKWLTQLYEVHEKYGISITMVSDDIQCSPVEGGSIIHYNYTDSVSIKEKCRKRTVVTTYSTERTVAGTTNRHSRS